MILWGLAILAACIAADKHARPHAFILASGWLLGFYASLWWPINPLISTVAGLLFLHLHLRSPAWWKFVLAALAFFMLGMDFLYASYLLQGVWIGPQYDLVLCVCLAAQLALVAHRGILNGVHWLGDRLHSRFSGRSVPVGARRDSEVS